MHNLRIKILVIAGVFILLGTASCKKWINDTPQPEQVDESAVFSTEKGFQEALNGVYLKMADSSLYGRDLTMGVLSLLGRSYDVNIKPAIGDLFYQSALYNLKHQSLNRYSADVWIKMYQSVANLNNLLINLEAKKSMFTGNNYNQFKGEALALRAYLHFDLLRLFATAPLSGGLSAPGIPYVTTISPTVSPTATVAEALEKCIADLKAAENLLNPTDLRNYQFNNWAIKGLLARLYLYKGDTENAQLYANAVIKGNKFILAKNNADLLFTSENLFNLFVYETATFRKSVMATDKAGLGFAVTSQTSLYATGSGTNADWRKSFVAPISGAALVIPKKFYPLDTRVAFPMIRLTEMYYIAAECATNNNDLVTATALLDTVRVHRNLPKYTLTALTSDSLNVEIRKEHQKEFIGEGQVFFYFKRKNMPFASLPFTAVPVDGNATYVFVKPE